MKKILGVYTSPRPHWVGDGFPVRTLFSYDSLGKHVSPFLLLDFAGPHDFPATSQRRGVGQHPHRGFETVTIVYKGELEHRDSTGAPHRHLVLVTPGTRMDEIYGTPELLVNSAHHQAVKQPGAGLRVCAQAPDFAAHAGSTRFLGNDDGMSGVGERVAQDFQLGGLAAAVNAFETDEDAGAIQAAIIPLRVGRDV